MPILNHSKMIVIGLDGLDWRLLNKFIKAGDLPNFEKILKDGVSCRIVSSMPPVTVPSWVNAFTGVNPGKHGIFHFTKLLPSGNIKINTLRDLKVDPVWRILSDHGRKVAIIRFPLGLPTPRDGIYIGGFLAPKIDERSVQPRELVEKLKKMDYPLASNFIDQVIFRIKNKPKKALNYLLGVFKKRAKVMKYVMETYNPDFIFSLFDTTDRLFHAFIDHEEIIIMFLKEIDKFLGDILKLLDENTYLITFSDHGFEKIDKYFFPNDFLVSKGYLKISNLAKTFNRARFYILEHFPVYFARLLPTYLLKTMYRKMANITYTLNFKDGELAKFSLAHFIKINPMLDKEKYNRIRDQIISELNSLRDEEGNKIVEPFKREEIYRGSQVKFAPDVILLMKEGYTISSAISGKIIRNRFFAGKAGDHVSVTAMQTAFFAAYHKEYALDATSTKGQVRDIAPTILYLMGLRVPEWMEGKVLVKL